MTVNIGLSFTKKCRHLLIINDWTLHLEYSIKYQLLNNDKKQQSLENTFKMSKTSSATAKMGKHELSKAALLEQKNVLWARRQAVDDITKYQVLRCHTDLESERE